MSDHHADSKLLAGLQRHFDHAYLLLDVLIEGASLSTKSASLCESYYGMQRRGRAGPSLSTLERTAAIFEIVSCARVPRC